MDLDTVKTFISSFAVDEEEVTSFLENKKLFVKFNHIFLVEKGFSGKKVSDNQLLYIQLERLLPSKYFLLELKDLVSRSLFLKSRDVSLKFLYGKDLPAHLDYGVKLEEGKRYLVDFQGEILGYVQCISENGNLRLVNEFHIGKYLKEGN